MRFFWLLAASSVLVLPAQADPARDALAQIAKCADIAAAVERLTCYDAAAGGAKNALATTPVVEQKVAVQTQEEEGGGVLEWFGLSKPVTKAEDFGKPPAPVTAGPKEVTSISSNVVELAKNAYGRSVFILGNGGSASTASHMAADLVKNTIGPNMRRFRIMSLNDNIPLLTALSNDLGYDNMFAEQLQNLIQPGDVLIVISGSGNSPNVLKAMEYARSRSAQVAALLGFGGGKAAELADLVVLIDSDDYGVVEDAHLIINHILVEHFRQRLAGEKPFTV